MIPDAADESSSNVVAFKPKPAPTLQYVEIRLNEEDCSLTLSAHDDAGTIVTFEYSLTSKSPETFSLDELRTAWDRWRGTSTKAS
jgi:hypothetical protein